MIDHLFGASMAHVHHGDGILHMPDLPSACMDLTVFSPPFPALYAYTSEAGDIGNSEDLRTEGKLHLSFFYKQLARLIKPGRVVICHVMQIPRMKRAGGQGLADFRGLNIRLAERAGLVFAYDWLVRKNPQKQAITTKSRELQFAGLESDRARCRGCLGDYLLKFVKPGDNAVPVDSKGEVSRNDWIVWAESSWNDINESDTLNVRAADDNGDTRHICPLQLEIYRRFILMFSNPGEIVFDPFAGIGSGGFSALGGESPKTGKAVHEPRRFYGCELKDSYHDQALINIDRAIKHRQARQKTLWSMIDEIDQPSSEPGPVETPTVAPNEPDPTLAAPPMSEDDAIDMELLSALYATSGAHERWRNLREVGANDDTLRQAISREFEERGDASGVCGSPGHMVKGSQEPKFWLGQDSSGKPTLVGSELLAKVRILLAIGQPKPGDVPNLKNILAAHPGLLLLFRVGESCLFPHQPHVQEAAKYGVPASFCVNDEAAMIKKLLNAGCRVGVCEPVKDSTVVPVACDMSAVLESGAVEEEIPITRDTLLTGVPGLHPDTVSTLSQRSVRTVADVLFRAARSPGEKLSDRIWSAVRNIASYIDAEEATRAARVLAEIGLQLGEVDAPPVKKTRQSRKRKEATRSESADGLFQENT